MMSNVVGDSESIRSLVQRHQDKPKAIASHCSTRFGTLIFILWDVLARMQECHQGSCVQ
jgi:hypothetical protein